MGGIVTVLLEGFIVTFGVIAVLVCYVRASRERREKLGVFSMGLGNKRRKTMRHAILNVSAFKNVGDYISGLTARGASRTFQKVDESFSSNNITVTTSSYEDIGWEHFLTIFSHEAKVYSLPRACLASLMRILSISITAGTVDNYRINGRLVAFECTIIKGNTLRAMWFYQRKEVSKYMIWFHSVRTAVVRAIATPGVEFVDLGPSYNAEVAKSKERFNFINTLDWKEMCDYSGPFKDPAPIDKHLMN